MVSKSIEDYLYMTELKFNVTKHEVMNMKGKYAFSKLRACLALLFHIIIKGIVIFLKMCS